MKIVFILILVGIVVGVGILNFSEQRKITMTLDEIVRFISFVKAELNYRSTDFDNLFLKGEKQNYKFISFSGGDIMADSSIGKRYSEEFSAFVSGIGTTDETGQLALCDEYSSRFCRYFDERRVKEKEKIQVNAAVTVLGAVCVFVFFL